MAIATPMSLVKIMAPKTNPPNLGVAIAIFPFITVYLGSENGHRAYLPSQFVSQHVAQHSAFNLVGTQG